MGLTGDMQPQEVNLVVPPYKVTFFGTVVSPQNEQAISAGAEDGEPVTVSTTGKLHLEIYKDGRWENVDSGEQGDLDSGGYVLENGGLYHVEDHQAVFDR